MVLTVGLGRIWQHAGNHSAKVVVIRRRLIIIHLMLYNTVRATKDILCSFYVVKRGYGRIRSDRLKS
jgi:hypothetical protein